MTIYGAIDKLRMCTTFRIVQNYFWRALVVLDEFLDETLYTRGGHRAPSGTSRACEGEPLPNGLEKRGNGCPPPWHTSTET